MAAGYTKSGDPPEPTLLPSPLELVWKVHAGPSERVHDNDDDHLEDRGVLIL